MSLNLESCSREEACTALGKSEKMLDELLEKLQDWLKLQPHLPQDVSKKELEHYILGTKMSLEQAKHKLDMHYTMRRLVPEIFANRDPRGPGLTGLHKIAYVVYLPKLTPEKYKVAIAVAHVNDDSKFSSLDGFKYTAMMEDILIDESRSLGSIFIFDMMITSLGFIAKFTPTVMRKAEVAMSEGCAVRIRAVHFLNVTPIAENIIALAKKVLKPKIAERVHAHPKGQYESLHRHIPKSMLPKDYGGEEPSIAHLAELWRQKVDERRDWFLEQDKFTVDERLRPGPAFDGESLFGFSGSFRKLDVD